MEALFGSNNHAGHETADLASLIIAQAALEVPRLLGLLAMARFTSDIVDGSAGGECRVYEVAALFMVIPWPVAGNIICFLCDNYLLYARTITKVLHNEIFKSGGDKNLINRILSKGKNGTDPENKDDGESDDDEDEEGDEEDAENQEEEEDGDDGEDDDGNGEDDDNDDNPAANGEGGSDDDDDGGDEEEEEDDDDDGDDDNEEDEEDGEDEEEDDEDLPQPPTKKRK